MLAGEPSTLSVAFACRLLIASLLIVVTHTQSKNWFFFFFFSLSRSLSFFSSLFNRPRRLLEVVENVFFQLFHHVHHHLF